LDGTARQFAIGDWIVLGFDRYQHGKWDIVQQVFPDRSLDQLRWYETVARNVKSVTRVTDLTWTHHRVVASIDDPAKQRQWLERDGGRLLGRLIQQGQERGEIASQNSGRPNKCDTVSHLDDLGISRKESSRAQQVLEIPEQQFEQHIEETKTTGKELTTAGVYRCERRPAPRAPLVIRNVRAGGVEGVGL
jgi:hypothetical protein